MGTGLLKTREPKSVMAGIRQRGQWDVIGDGRDEQELEVEVKKDTVVDSGELVKFELGGLCLEPFDKSDLVVVKVRSLKDIEVPLALLLVSQWVVDVAGNGGLRKVCDVCYTI